MLSSHQHSPLRYFPDIVALGSVKQICELHLSNECRQAQIVAFKRNFQSGCEDLNIICYILH